MTQVDVDTLGRLAKTRAMVMDLDGTLVLGDRNIGGHRLLPGSAELIARLRQWDLPFRVFTNGTIHSPRAYAEKLRKAGLDVQDEEMMTPSSAAADYFLAKGIRRVLVLGNEGVWRPLADAGIEVIDSRSGNSDAQAVYVGWYRDFTMPDLETAAHAIWKGAILTTASNVPFFATSEGRAIGASFSINAMLRALTGARILVLGKPSRDALRSAARRLGIKAGGVRNITVMGDDPQLEMAMANAAGAVSVGVTTGLNTADMLAQLPAKTRPSIIVENAAGLLRLLEQTR